MNEQLRILGDRMDELDTELYAAEQAGNTSQQIAVLRERGRCWREWAAHLEKSGRDNVGAVLSAQRDEASAFALESGAR